MWNTIKGYVSELSFHKLLPAIIALALGLIAAKLLCRLFDKALEKSRLERSLHSFLRSGFKILIYVLLLLIVAGTMGFNVSSLVALLSVVSLAFSLAVQGTLANIAGGLQILTSHPFRVGDFVELGDLSGTVKEIRMVYTVITTVDNKEIFIPNSDVAAARVTNYTAEGKRRVDFTFGISYGCDAREVKEALLACTAQEKVYSDPAPFVGLLNYGDSAVEYVLRVWCKTEDYWDVYFAIQERAQGLLAQHGIELTYPHLNVHLDK